MPEYSTILTETLDRVGLVRLNRPQVMNALSRLLLEELMDAMAGFDSAEGIGAIVVTGNERAFAAGADVKEMADASAVEMFLCDQISLFDRIRSIKKPIIAAVSGFCLGGGCELAMSCDMIVAAEFGVFWPAGDQFRRDPWRRRNAAPDTRCRKDYRHGNDPE